jgi:hypothetical protein
MECQNSIHATTGRMMMNMTRAGGPLGPVEKDHVQLLQELLVEVRGLREHMHTVSQYVEGLTNKIEEVLNDNPLEEAPVEIKLPTSIEEAIEEDR